MAGIAKSDAPQPMLVTTPVPDPTTLTNELVSKATSALRELLESEIQRQQEKGEIYQEWFNTIPQTTAKTAILEEKIRALTEVVAVFKQTVNERFELGDVQTEKAARDVKSAVDAAFAAAKEAVGEQNKANSASITKSEVSFTKAVDQLSDTVKLNTKTTDDKIDDLKDRLVAMEGRGAGHRQGLSDTSVMILVAMSVVGVVISLVSFFVHVAAR
jgi:hypothetical protein